MRKHTKKYQNPAFFSKLNCGILNIQIFIKLNLLNGNYASKNCGLQGLQQKLIAA